VESLTAFRGGVELGEARVEDGFVLGEDGVEGSVLGDGAERDVGDGLADEAACHALHLVLQPVMVELRGHQPLPGDGDGDARGVDGDPAPPPLLGDDGGGA